MINGIHALIYTTEVEETMQLFKNMDFDHVDREGSWPIFGVQAAEFAAHPLEEGGEPRFEFWFYCDDIELTVQDLVARGIDADEAIQETDFGLVSSITLPDGESVGLYEPTHVQPD